VTYVEVDEVCQAFQIGHGCGVKVVVADVKSQQLLAIVQHTEGCGYEEYATD